MRIALLKGELGRLKLDARAYANVALSEENDRLIDEIARLRTAIKPFADLAGKLDAAPNLVGLLTEEDFKRAAAALDHEQGGGVCRHCNGKGSTPMATIAIALPPRERRELEQSAADHPVTCWACAGTGRACEQGAMR